MPNIFDLLGNFNRPRNITIIRQERIKREGSPYYTWTPGAITAGGGTLAIYIPDQFPASRKYQPLDWIEIVNNEASNDLRVVINGNTTFPVPAKTIRTIDNESLRHIQLINDGGSNTTPGLIYATLQKQPLTIDKWARRQ